MMYCNSRNHEYLAVNYNGLKHLPNAVKVNNNVIINVINLSGQKPEKFSCVTAEYQLVYL